MFSCDPYCQFDLLARIPLPRVAEFSYPFLVSSFSGGDEDQRVVILYKRILRLLSEYNSDKGGKKYRMIQEPGCYAIHRIPYRYGSDNGKGFILAAMERRTGMIAITARSLVTMSTLKHFLDDVFDKLQVPCQRLVLLSYYDRTRERDIKKQQESPNCDGSALATVIRKSFEELEASREEWLGTGRGRQGITLESEVVPHPRDRASLQLPEKNPLKLSKHLQVLADIYNQQTRVMFPRENEVPRNTIKPRIKDLATPIDRLFFTLKYAASNSRAKPKLPVFDDVCDKATFARRVAEKERYKIYGGRPVAEGRHVTYPGGGRRVVIDP